MTLGDVGVDSNVFNESGTPQEDFSATAGAEVDVGLRMNRLVASYKSSYEYIYFEKFAAERPFNFSMCTSPIPLGFRAIIEGATLRIGGRGIMESPWRVSGGAWPRRGRHRSGRSWVQVSFSVSSGVTSDRPSRA